MRPAERVALLTALMEATKAELDAAKAQALATAKEVGVKSFATPFGGVTIGQKGAAPYVSSPAMFLAYVQHNYPGEVVREPTVRPSFTTALLQRVEWSDVLQEYVDTETGDAIPGLSMSEPGDPYITWPSGDEQKRTKEEAKQWFREKADTVLAGMLAIEQGAAS